MHAIVFGSLTIHGTLHFDLWPTSLFILHIIFNSLLVLPIQSAYVGIKFSPLSSRTWGSTLNEACVACSCRRTSSPMLKKYRCSKTLEFGLDHEPFRRGTVDSIQTHFNSGLLSSHGMNVIHFRAYDC